MPASNYNFLSDGRGDGVVVNRSDEAFAFFGGTPATRRASAVQATTATTRAVSTGHYGFTSTQANAILDGYNEIVATLTAHNLWKGGA